MCTVQVIESTSRTGRARPVTTRAACLAGCDTKGRVATLVPLPCLGLVTTPNLSRDPLEARPCRDIKSHVATPLQPTVGLFRLRHQKSCSYTSTVPLCRDTNFGRLTASVSRHRLSPLLRLLVMTLRTCRDTPKGPLCCDMKDHVVTQNWYTASLLCRDTTLVFGPTTVPITHSHVATPEYM